jgi:hypothetical protein
MAAAFRQGSAAVSFDPSDRNQKASENVFEPAGSRLRPSAGAMMRRQIYLGGKNFMKSIRPDNTDPIPLRNPPPRMGIIMIRFVGLLVVAVVVLALIWSR